MLIGVGVYYSSVMVGQETFTDVTVSKCKPNTHMCEKIHGYRDGQTVTCPYSASYVLESSDHIEYRCKTHVKNTWLDMVEK